MTTDDAAELRAQLAQLREEMAEGFAALDRRLTQLANGLHLIDEREMTP